MRQCLENKKGVSLAVLVVTIIISLIILSISVVGVKNSIDNAALVSFAGDLNTISNLTQQYYLQNETYPKKAGTDAISQGKILEMSGSNSNKLLEEMRLNNDIVASNDMGSYYIIDLLKLDIDSSTKGFNGLKEPSSPEFDASDVFVVAYPSQNVYYVKGLAVKSDVYFSLTSKLSTVTKVQKTESEIITNVQTAANMVAKKTIKTWTNEMGISLQVTCDAGDEIYIKAGNQEEKKLYTNVGTTTFIINKLKDLSQVSQFSEIDDTSFSALPQDQKKLYISKKNNGADKGTITLDLSNYETGDPTKITEPQLIDGEENNKVKFKVNDSLSGIKEVRYEYIKKFNDEGKIENYYEGIDVLDTNYMKSRAKKGSVDSNGNVELTIPKDIEGIQILVLDRAGNGIVITQNTANSIYIGIVPKEITLSKATFKLVFASKYGIKNVNTSISMDGKTYTAPITIPNFQTTAQLASIDVDNYTNLENANKGVYVKVSAQDNSSSSQVRVKLIGNDDSAKLGTKDKYASTWDNPYIPVGFEHLEGTVADGFVIKDVSSNEQTNGNEFVWIPVENIDEFYPKFPSYSDTSPTKIVWTDAKSNEITTTYEYTQMYNSVKKYGGFYIARYDAGIAVNMPQVAITSSSTAYGDGNYKPVSKKDAIKWGYIAWGGARTDIATDGRAGNDLASGAVKASRCMYPDITKISEFALPTNLTSQTDVISTLCYETQWDAMAYFLQDMTNVNTKRPYVVDNVDLPVESVKNIYQLSSNVNNFNWTMGFVSNWPVRFIRSIDILKGGYTYGAHNTYVDNICSFRPTLYISE